MVSMPWDTDLLHGSSDSSLLTRNSNLDISPLPLTQYRGLIAISVLAFISVLATTGLLCFITYRIFFSKRGDRRYLGHNQYIILIYNLLLADLQQSLGFIICIHWVRNDAIRAGTAACFLQGLWLQVGDPGSGLFVMAIAAHTFMLVTFGRKIEHKWFVTAVIAVWFFLAIIVAIPIASHGVDVMIPSGAWVSLFSLYFCGVKLTEQQVLDQQQIRSRPSMDSLSLDLPRRIRHRHSLLNHVLSTSSSNLRIFHPRRQRKRTGRESETLAARGRIHGYLPSRLRCSLPAPCCWPHGFRSW